MQQAWEKRGMYVEFWWESQKEGDHWEDLDEGVRIRLLYLMSHRLIMQQLLLNLVHLFIHHYMFRPLL
jgi:hypothetical protein